MKRSAGHIAAVAAALLAGSCVSPHQSAVTDVNPARWDSRAEIRLPNADTVSLRDAVIFLRCNDCFAEDTLTVRIATVTPDSLRFGEWFLLVIPHPKGPAALMREAAIPYRRRIRLTQHGDYRCSVTPVRPVRGVEAVGVDLQQSMFIPGCRTLGSHLYGRGPRIGEITGRLDNPVFREYTGVIADIGFR